MNKAKFEEMIIRHEGLRLMPYTCTAGKLTIGIGRNIEDRGITDAEARFMLQNDIQEITVGLVRFEWFINLSEVRRDIIVNMAFMGLGTFLKFKKLIQALKDQDYEEAAYQMMESKWATQVGNRAIELSSMMIHGKYL